MLKTCVICGRKFSGKYPHTAEPVAKGICCTNCWNKTVKLARNQKSSEVEKNGK